MDERTDATRGPVRGKQPEQESSVRGQTPIAVENEEVEKQQLHGSSLHAVQAENAETLC